jgi:hypothetical protein
VIGIIVSWLRFGQISAVLAEHRAHLLLRRDALVEQLLEVIPRARPRLVLTGQLASHRAGSDAEPLREFGLPSRAKQRLADRSHQLRPPPRRRARRAVRVIAAFACGPVSTCHCGSRSIISSVYGSFANTQRLAPPGLIRNSPLRPTPAASHCACYASSALRRRLR